MNGHLYFPNNLKYIKDHIYTYMISYKKFFQLMVRVFKENLNLQLPHIFYSSIRFVSETVFISEQMQITSLELCQRLETNLSPSLMFLAIWFCSPASKQFRGIFSGKFMGGYFTWEQMIRSGKAGSSWLRGFKIGVKLVFLSLTLTWVTDILFETLTPQIGN